MKPYPGAGVGPRSRDKDDPLTAPRISFEFFPPRTEEQQLILESTWQKLAPLRPEYLSVTFGAGGSTLEATRETVAALDFDGEVPARLWLAVGDAGSEFREAAEDAGGVGVEATRVALDGDLRGRLGRERLDDGPQDAPEVARVPQRRGTAADVDAGQGWGDDGRAAALTGDDKAQPVLFFCLQDCWMSWNAAKRALEEEHNMVLGKNYEL